MSGLIFDGQHDNLLRVADSFNGYYPSSEVSSFENWINRTSEVNCVDEARFLLYYGFQPLFDALMEDRVPVNIRSAALKVLDRIMVVGRKYLHSFHYGTPDVKIIRDLARNVSEVLTNINYYYFKKRNIDTNYINSNIINLFMRKFINHVQNDGNVPDVIIGCACGSAEIVMALGGVLNLPIEFIRKSKRREDDEAKIIPENEKRIARMCKGKRVLVIEDYIVTSKSIRFVMDKVRSFGSIDVTGACINFTGDADYVHCVLADHKFNLFKLKEHETEATDW